MKMHSTCVEGDQADLHEITGTGVFDCMVFGFAHWGEQIEGCEILLLASVTAV